MNQNETLVKHLIAKGSITQLEAIGVHRIFNIKGRIEELRNPAKKAHLVPAGKQIVTDYRIDSTGKKYAVYQLVNKQQEVAEAV